MARLFGSGGVLDQQRKLEVKILAELAAQGIHGFSKEATEGKPYETNIGDFLVGGELSGERRVALYDKDDGVEYGFAVLIDESVLAQIQRTGIEWVRKGETSDEVRKRIARVEADQENHYRLTLVGNDSSMYRVQQLLRWYDSPTSTRDIADTALAIERVAGISRELEEKYGSGLTARVVTQINGRVTTKLITDKRTCTADPPEFEEELSPFPTILQGYVVLSYQQPQQREE